ncbi:MAG: hypothetical protein R3308_05525 [Thiohalobacterales bacterium]|nr:hypothetical protein [Thiohalobacterales bacterium]
MMTSTSASRAAGNRFEDLNWTATPPLPRDRCQSHRLHQPAYLINTIDPITGHDIDNVLDHPCLVDGNLTIYFESEASMQAYLDTPLNHPCEHTPGGPSDEIDRGG